MNNSEILSMTDHTILSQTATWEQVKSVIDEGIKYKTASVCIPPSFVETAAEYADGRVKICTVIGFPNGYNTTAVKCFEAADAIKNGADEIDMVINLGRVKQGLYDEILNEINRVKKSCGDKPLKVITETCFLSEDEKIRLCQTVSSSDAQYIKTSTGFGTGGATKDDIALFASHIAQHIKIKAAGGIKTLEDAQDFISLGASRLGSSGIVKMVEKANKTIPDKE